MSRAVLSLGSNIGNRLSHLASARDAFRPWVLAASPIFSTPPWGGIEQQDYLNAVLIVDDPVATPRDWLQRAQAAERAAGRTRELRWGPRTLDVDVVTVDGIVSDDPQLTLPHPRAAQRAFVLVPWLAVDPVATLGGHRVSELISALAPADVTGVTGRPDLGWG